MKKLLEKQPEDIEAWQEEISGIRRLKQPEERPSAPLVLDEVRLSPQMEGVYNINKGYAVFKKVRILCENDEYYIGNDFAFLYFTEEDSPKPSELLLDGAFIKRENPDFSEVEKIIQTFLSALSIPEQEKKFAYELDFTDFYASGTESVVCVMQKINGKDTENRLYLLLSEGHVIAADGFFALTSPQRRLSTQTVGMMEILFSEKNYLDERYRESGEISRENMILSSVKISYAVYFDADGSFYFVPVRTLVYQNGESRTYNDVSGEIYS